MAQEDWMFIQTQLDSEKNGISEATPFINEDSNELFLFLKEKQNGIVYKINEKKEILGEISIYNIPTKAYELVGQTFYENKYTLYFTNQTKRRHSYIQFNFETNTSKKVDEIDLPLKRERVVEHFGDGDTFYILTAIKNTSKLKLYTFNVQGNYSERIIDLSSEVFETSRGLKLSLYDFIFAGNNTATTKKVEVGVPISLETAKADNKLYFKHGIATLTLDYIDRYSYIIDIDVNDASYNLDRFEHMGYDNDRLRTKSNSFIYDNYFFNIYASSVRLNFSIYNRETKEMINEFSVNQDSEIAFKNSPIILEGGGFSKYRELEKTKQFLRKIRESNIALSVFKNQEKYVVTLGASKTSGGGYYGPVSGGLIGGLISGALYSSFASYNGTKSTRINCLFDDNFNHIQGDIPENSFDKVDEYTKSIKNINAETLFNHKGDYVWGSYNKGSRIYKLVKF